MRTNRELRKAVFVDFRPYLDHPSTKIAENFTKDADRGLVMPPGRAGRGVGCVRREASEPVTENP